MSWVRHDDVSLISVGKLKYIKDERFKVINEENSQDWVLAIRYKPFFIHSILVFFCLLALGVASQSCFSNVKWNAFRSLKKSDEGLYECQVNASPMLRLTMYLKVVGKFALFLYYTFHIRPKLSKNAKKKLTLVLMGNKVKKVTLKKNCISPILNQKGPMILGIFFKSFGLM